MESSFDFFFFFYLRAGIVEASSKRSGNSLQQQAGRDRVHYANFCPVACEEWRKHWRFGGQGIIEHLEVSWCRCGNVEGMGKGWGEASVTTRHYSQQFDPTGASSPLTPSNHFRATIFQSARVPRV